MIGKIISAVMAREVAEIRRRASGAAVLLVALVLLLFAVLFGLFALYLWLSTFYAPWKAAVIVAAAVLFVAIVLALVGRSTMSGRKRHQAVRQEEALATALTSEPSPEPAETRRQKVTVAVAAAMLGIIIGRTISK